VPRGSGADANPVAGMEVNQVNPNGGTVVAGHSSGKPPKLLEQMRALMRAGY